MKTIWGKKVGRGLLLAGLVAAGMSLVGCADEYAAYPGNYHGGYYAGYSSYPYYGGAYGYPYRTYGPYYGGGYYGYGAPYYGYAPYYGGGSVVVSTGRTYYSGNRGYVYRDRYGRLHTTRQVNRVRNASRTRTNQTTTRSRRVQQYQNDEESRYYAPR